MHRYILRRLIFLVFVIIGITALLFVIMYFLPGDPARAAAGPGAKPEQVERIRIRLGSAIAHPVSHLYEESGAW